MGQRRQTVGMMNGFNEVLWECERALVILNERRLRCSWSSGKSKGNKTLGWYNK